MWSVPFPRAFRADGRRYRLTVYLGDSRREVTATDPVETPAIAELIAFVEKHGQR